MVQPWMIPVAVMIGVAGTRTALQARRLIKAASKDWWMVVVLAWSPLVCWVASQVVLQD